MNTGTNDMWFYGLAISWWLALCLRRCKLQSRENNLFLILGKFKKVSLLVLHCPVMSLLARFPLPYSEHAGRIFTWSVPLKKICKNTIIMENIICMWFYEIDDNLEVKCCLSFSHAERELKLRGVCFVFFLRQVYCSWPPLILKGLRRLSLFHLKQLMPCLELFIDSFLIEFFFYATNHS